jgi:dihydroorotase
MTEQLRAYVNARLLDPASGLDGTGAVLIDGNKIIDTGPHLFPNGPPANVQVIDCKGYCLAPNTKRASRRQVRRPRPAA